MALLIICAWCKKPLGRKCSECGAKLQDNSCWCVTCGNIIADLDEKTDGICPPCAIGLRAEELEDRITCAHCDRSAMRCRECACGHFPECRHLVEDCPCNRRTPEEAAEIDRLQAGGGAWRRHGM